MPTTKPKAVPVEWLEQHILPKLGDALKKDLEATLNELKQLPTSVSYYGFSTIIIRTAVADMLYSFQPAVSI